MAFSHGKSAVVYAHGQNLSPYLKSASVSGSADTAETSTFGVAAKTYVAGLIDAVLSLEGFLDGAADAGDEIVTELFALARIFSHYPAGDAEGAWGRHMEAVETSYEVGSDIGDAASISVEAQSNIAMERGQSLKAGADSITIDANGNSVDGAASSANGGAAYLHVLTKTGGTTLAVTIEHSDTGAGAWSTIATFTTASAEDTAQRVVVAPGTTVKQYLRAVWDVGAGGTWKINVAFARK